jgi:hypothetical protein
MSSIRLLSSIAMSVVAGAFVLGTANLLQATAGPQTAAKPPAEALTCRGVITPSLSADHVRVCDSVTVTTRSEAACSGCVDGLNVVFLQQLEPC